MYNFVNKHPRVLLVVVSPARFPLTRSFLLEIVVPVCSRQRRARIIFWSTRPQLLQDDIVDAGEPSRFICFCNFSPISALLFFFCDFFPFLHVQLFIGWLLVRTGALTGRSLLGSLFHLIFSYL